MKDDLTRYRSRCTRFLTGHGRRSAADLLAMVPAGTEMDNYGAGGAVEKLEAEVSKILGKPAAAFFPSGTMAQQAALRIHADRRKSRAVAFHPTCHLEIHEDKAYQRLHDLIGVKIGHPRRLITLDDLKGVKEPLAAVLLELPQREIGGWLPSWADLQEQVDFIRSRGAAVHMDGARLWQCGPCYKKSPAQIAALFDTVYVSFYKDLGALAGSCLAGPEDVIDEARLWRKRHGGTLYGMWPNAASALTGLKTRLPKMARYHEHAFAIAKAVRGVANVEVVPDPPQGSMMHLLLRVGEERMRANACAIAKKRGVYTFAQSAPGPSASTRVVELTVGDATLRIPPREAAEILGELVA